MKTGSIGFILVFCLGAAGQVNPAPVRILAVTLTGEGPSFKAHVRNDYSSAATAWILQCETAQGQWVHNWHDEELSFETSPLGSGKESEELLPSVPPRMLPGASTAHTCANIGVVAAVFADGTVSGDLGWINAVVADRRKVYEDIGKARDILSKAAADGSEREVLIQQITEWSKSLTRSGMAAVPAPRQEGSVGFQASAGAPSQRMFPSPVPGAALYLLTRKALNAANAAIALDEWRARLATLQGVAAAQSPSLEVTRARDALRTPPSAMLGKLAPKFTLRDVDGKPVSLESLRGQTVLLDFWATWCVPCRESMPEIQALHEQYKNKGLVVLGIDTNETEEKARPYFAEQKYTFTNLLASGSSVVDDYNAHLLPHVVLIGKDGVVRYVHEGSGPTLDITPEVKKLIEP